MTTEIESSRFYKMHQFEVLYESRDPGSVLPVERFRKGISQFGFQVTLYDRPPSSATLPMGGNSAAVAGTSAFVTGYLWTTIKFLDRLEQRESNVESPVFFFAFRGYDSKLMSYREKIREELMSSLGTCEEFKVASLMEVLIGGLYVIKSKCQRGRVTKINLDTKTVQYWAIDEAVFGECKPSDLLILNGVLANLDMLAVPGVFETDPSPSKLQKFEGKTYSVAKIAQPTYGFDFGPRKINLN